MTPDELDKIRSRATELRDEATTKDLVKGRSLFDCEEIEELANAVLALLAEVDRLKASESSGVWEFDDQA